MVSASNFISVDKDSLVRSVNAFLPETAFIPLFEDDAFCSDSEILIKEGDSVKEGEVIAKNRNVFVHSSIPGIVQKIEQHQYPNGKQGLCAEIKLNGSFSFLGKKLPEHDWKTYESATLEYLLRDNGVINTFSKNVLVFQEIKKIRTPKSAVLVVRLFDSDPSVVTESFVSKNFLPQIVEGSKILAKAFGVTKILFAFSSEEKIDFKPYLVDKDSPDEFSLFSIEIDAKKYPRGMMHDISQTAKKIFPENSDCAKLGRKDLFVDSVTALNAYNAIVFAKPVVSDFIYVTGGCLNCAAMLNVRIGTTLRDIVQMCGGFKRKLSKIIINGKMLGVNVGTLDLPVSRNIKSIEYVPKNEISIPRNQNCIRCGNCRKICPVSLWPGNLYRIANLETIDDLDKNEKKAMKTAVLCIGCSLCNSVCPARLPLSQSISILKEASGEDNNEI